MKVFRSFLRGLRELRGKNFVAFVAERFVPLVAARFACARLSVRSRDSVVSTHYTQLLSWQFPFFAAVRGSGRC